MNENCSNSRQAGRRAVGQSGGKAVRRPGRQTATATATATAKATQPKETDSKIYY